MRRLSTSGRFCLFACAYSEDFVINATAMTQCELLRQPPIGWKQHGGQVPSPLLYASVLFLCAAKWREKEKCRGRLTCTFQWQLYLNCLLQLNYSVLNCLFFLGREGDAFCNRCGQCRQFEKKLVLNLQYDFRQVDNAQDESQKQCHLLQVLKAAIIA